jgi:hypothetical protein
MSFRDILQSLKANKFVLHIEQAAQQYPDQWSLDYNLKAAMTAMLKMRKDGADRIITAEGWKYIRDLSQELMYRCSSEGHFEAAKTLEYFSNYAAAELIRHLFNNIKAEE